MSENNCFYGYKLLIGSVGATRERETTFLKGQNTSIVNSEFSIKWKISAEIMVKQSYPQMKEN